MLFSKRSKSFSLGVIPIITIMAAILILSGCGDSMLRVRPNWSE